MNFRLSFLFRKLFFFYLMILCGWLASCGLRTAPRNLPEIKQKSTFSDFKVRQRGERIRLSWKINEAARKNALKNFDVNSGLKDYFLIREHQIPLDCMACETVLRAPLRVLFSSSAIIRDGNHLYYYLELPERDLKLREYEDRKSTRLNSSHKPISYAVFCLKKKKNNKKNNNKNTQKEHAIDTLHYTM